MRALGRLRPRNSFWNSTGPPVACVRGAVLVALVGETVNFMGIRTACAYLDICLSRRIAGGTVFIDGETNTVA